MTIEISPPTHQPAKAAGASGKAAKGPGDAAHDAAATGFLAILGALADTAPQEAAPLVALADAPLDASQTALPFDAAALLQQNPQIAAAQAALRAAEGPGAQVPAGLAGEGAGAAPQASAAASALAARGRMQPGADTGKPAADALLAGDAPPMGLQRTGAHANKLAKDKAALAANDTGTPVNPAAVATERMEVKDSKLLAAIEQARASVAARTAEPALAVALAKSEKPQGERMAQAARTAEVGHTGSALDVASPGFSQGVAPTEVPPETQVAEQVTYWISQNVQNAELQLDGLGESPVEVSIQVQGNEAHITFRTDEAQTRGVLEGAGAQLKDMLQREGVLLSGVSVGTSGGGDASGAGSGGERRGRAQVRQVTLAPLEAASAPSARRVGQEAGRSVDLFV